MDEKDREIQELRRQVESLKAEVVKRGKWIEFKRTYLECPSGKTMMRKENKHERPYRA